ncbi:MAG: CDF family Co(II)/Ni(II) efflux transporter DmeF [Proteobacteria bacterium]|nr:CDF family Co(II)/Ni(II) efflux transporter DmeF [Pseudomonadota bacterium]MBU4472250.1 CDF family Co(II)/Ni(II) efflux transporter DmeF [Pseudomonadota bacterium]MCG2751945.1 CDF family Co(II)/Ni(II) efflux transporter DmeF [Desulfobacteraceae bacterium]
MHINHLDKWQHPHKFHMGSGHGERNTRRVVFLTAIMMTIEIIAGYAFGSMALLADGWHMGTHAMALGITLFAYYFARKNADNPGYSFGTGKVGVLAGFSSAVILGVVALLMAVESGKRFFYPVDIQFDQAIFVAVSGLMVNLFSAFLLQGREEHHDHHTGHNHPHKDHNLKAAYLHVLADALTSVLAIFALISSKIAGWIWMDPLMGIVGAVLISKWSYGLMKDTSKILLDSGVTPDLVSRIKKTIESHADNRVCDIHVWPLGSNHYSAILSIVTHHPEAPEYYKQILAGFEELDHITIEVNEADGEPCMG